MFCPKGICGHCKLYLRLKFLIDSEEDGSTSSICLWSFCFLRCVQPLGGFIQELRICEMLRIKAVDFFGISGGKGSEMQRFGNGSCENL